MNFERETLRISDDRKAIVDIETKTVENGSTIGSPTSNIRYQYDNHLGSASLELDASAAIISYEEYHPFGTTSYRSGRTQTEVSLKRYKYVGKERDDETGLYYYGARYYAGWIARFVSVDPLQHKYPHYTPYQYAGNKPVSYIDLDGLEEEKVNNNSPVNSDTDEKFSKGGDYVLSTNGLLTRVEGSQTERTRIIKRNARYDDDGNLKNKNFLDLGEVEIKELKHSILPFDDGSSIPLQTFHMHAGEESQALYNYIEGYISTEMSYMELEKANGEKNAYFTTN